MNVEDILKQFESGHLRAANYNQENDSWVVNSEAKSLILQVFKEGKNALVENNNYFIDKHNLPLQTFSLEQQVRLVPQGSAVRRGSFVGKSVIIMPPSYINIGAYVDSGTMVDSHCLVGSCAQVGKNVHLSAGVQIGGVLEPIGANPVIIEDDSFIGAGCILVEGVRVGKRAVLAPGVRLSRSIPVYHLLENRILEKNEKIPDGSIVVPGSRSIAKNNFAKELGLSLSCAIIVKIRDEGSDESLQLEDLLR